MAKILFAVEIDDNENVEEIMKKINGMMLTDCNAECGNKFSDAETMLSVQDIAEYLGVGRGTVYEFFDRSDFPGITIKNRHMVKKDLFLKFIDENYGRRKYSKRTIK